MRKVCAHYYLRPDGTFGKAPIVELSETGCILRVHEMGDNFKEEPGLEYFPGILSPGFVASYLEGQSSLNDRDKRIGLANGVLRFKEEVPAVATAEYQRAWMSIRQWMSTRTGSSSLGCTLLKYTYQAALSAGVDEWGVIAEGADPGLIVLQNIDLRTFSFTPKSSFKIIQK
ncbi:hypothetical protein [Carboxylicivirga taeanensis]|uniref:hypothetical protein n=1 Tax=Carboxylicivirga taeanensis TaxID=1416875 RepID=UPI003F6DBE0E